VWQLFLARALRLLNPAWEESWKAEFSFANFTPLAFFPTFSFSFIFYLPFWRYLNLICPFGFRHTSQRSFPIAVCRTLASVDRQTFLIRNNAPHTSTHMRGFSVGFSMAGNSGCLLAECVCVCGSVRISETGDENLQKHDGWDKSKWALIYGICKRTYVYFLCNCLWKIEFIFKFKITFFWSCNPMQGLTNKF